MIKDRPYRSRSALGLGSRTLRVFWGAASLGVIAGFLSWLLGGGRTCGDYSRQVEEKQIFRGITYGCERLEPTPESKGHVHWTRVDLSAPGIELYVTPLDSTAVGQGWQYRLRRIGEVITREHLAVVTNGALFVTAYTWWPRLTGDFANSVETVVADHVVSHVWEHTYLLWFDDQLTPHLELSKPPRAADLAAAKWGIGGQAVWLRDGEVWSGSDRTPDARTAVAIDPYRKILFLAVGEYISPRLLLQKLADLGAMDGMLLDGGGSTAMAIAKASGLSGGTLYGGWRPVATYFGVRALPLPAE